MSWIAGYTKSYGAGEVLTVHILPCNKAANSTADPLSILTEALDLLLDSYYAWDENLIGGKILARTDSTGATGLCAGNYIQRERRAVLLRREISLLDTDRNRALYLDDRDAFSPAILDMPHRVRGRCENLSTLTEN